MWRSRREVIGFAIICTALTVAGLLEQPHGKPLLEEIANRALGVFAIWTIAFLGLRIRGLANRVVRQARLIEELRDGIIVTDTKGRVESINKGAESMFGYTRSEILGQPASRLFQADESGELAGAFSSADVLMDGSFALRIPGTRKNGTVFPSRQWLMRRYGERDEPLGVTLHVADLSGDNSNSEAARRIETFYRDVLDHLPLQVALFDTKGRFLYLNPASLSSAVMRR